LAEYNIDYDANEKELQELGISVGHNDKEFGLQALKVI
jgi:hypothetical protein